MAIAIYIERERERKREKLENCKCHGLSYEPGQISSSITATFHAIGRLGVLRVAGTFIRRRGGEGRSTKNVAKIKVTSEWKWNRVAEGWSEKKKWEKVLGVVKRRKGGEHGRKGDEDKKMSFLLIC